MRKSIDIKPAAKAQGDQQILFDSKKITYLRGIESEKCIRGARENLKIKKMKRTEAILGATELRVGSSV